MDTATVATNAQQVSNVPFVTMLIFFGLFLYFAVWRPQNKRVKAQQALLKSLVVGDEVMTTSGLLGRVTKLNEQYVGLTVANNVELLVQKAAIVSLLPKGTMSAIA